MRQERRRTFQKRKSFNPRTRTGCDLRSLHYQLVGIGFNPRTRTGCDPASVRFARNRVCFNPRTRTGCDFTKHGIHKAVIVSIHAPARGATPLNNGLKSVSCFNPRTRTGCDLCTDVGTYNMRWFQSTHPHGVRLWYCLGFIIKQSFNPRTRTGCDFKTYFIENNSDDVSIHAPARGATSKTNCRRLATMFQSTHPHGVRLVECSK